MKQYQAAIIFLLLVGLITWGGFMIAPSLSQWFHQTAIVNTVTSPSSQNLFLSVSGTLQEAGSMAYSTNPDWWLNSGGYFYVASSGIASTIIGSLPTNDHWRLEYARTNPVDTDDGYHPQNIFRLVSQSKWQNYTEQAYFLIKANNLSASPNRNESNGLLLFNRYQTGQTLYYAGVRVDGTAVIKKKINGVYYTMAQVSIFPELYDHNTNPNLLPLNEWIGLRTVVVTNADGSVTVTLYTDIGRTGNWTEALTATDNGTQYGGAAITTAGYIGIRTDFMDVEFDGFQVKAL